MAIDARNKPKETSKKTSQKAEVKLIANEGLVDIAFLFASPRFFKLKFPAHDDPVEPVNYQDEIAQLKKAIVDSSLSVSLKVAPATVLNLRDALMQTHKILHIRCFGESGEILQSKMGDVAYNSYWDRGDYLLFEDEFGMGQAFGPAL